MIMSTRSLYFKLILWYSGLVIVMALCFGAYTYIGVRSRLYEEMGQTLTRRAHQIAENILIHADSQSVKAIVDQINEVYSPAANNRFIFISTDSIPLFFRSPPPKDDSFDPIAVPIVSSGPGIQLKTLPSGVTMLIVCIFETVADHNFLIEMGAPTTELQAALHGLIVTLLFGLPFVVFIVSAGGYALVRRSLVPVEAIRATAQQITFGNLSNRLPVAPTGDALEHLSVTLNQMLQRLEDAYQQASRFSADASHELRTPLTIMRGELESILQQELVMPETLRERLCTVLEETERLSRITESLFAISRLDAGEGRTKPITFYLIDLVQSTTDQMSLLAEVKSIVLSIEARDSVKVTGDATRLKQVVVNLVDNAIKYTPEGGKISIIISEIDRKACFSITDTGIGIPAESLPHIFERFYRADKARTREEGGAGLGLSIVRSIVQAQGGTVEVDSTEGKGTTFRVLMPLAEVNYETYPRQETA